MHDTSKSQNGESKLLKIVDTTKILGTHTLTFHDNLEDMEVLLPIPSLNELDNFGAR